MIKINLCNFNFFYKEFLTSLPNKVNDNVKILFNEEHKIEKNYINIIFETNLNKKYNNNFFVLYDDEKIKENLKKINDEIDIYWNCTSGNGPIELFYFKNTIQYKLNNSKKIAIYIAGACTYYNIVFNDNIFFYKELEKNGYQLDFYIYLTNLYFIKYYDKSIFGTNINGHTVTTEDIVPPSNGCDSYVVFKDVNIKKFFTEHDYYKDKIKFLKVEDDINMNISFHNMKGNQKKNNYKLYIKKNKCIEQIFKFELENENYSFYINPMSDTHFSYFDQEKLSFYLEKLNSNGDLIAAVSYNKFLSNYENMMYPMIFISNNLQLLSLPSLLTLTYNISKNKLFLIKCMECGTKYKIKNKLNICKICSSKKLDIKNYDYIGNWDAIYIKKYFDQNKINYMSISDFILQCIRKRKI